MKVLLIDDVEFEATRVKAFLPKLDRPVDLEWRPSLSAGLERVSKGGIDRVLLDLTVEDSLGLDTLGSFLKNHPEMPVIVLSSETDELIQREAIERGARDYLIKHELSVDRLQKALDA